MAAAVLTSPNYKEAFKDDKFYLKPDNFIKLADSIASYLDFDFYWINNDDQRSRVLTYYLPIALWLQKQV